MLELANFIAAVTCSAPAPRITVRNIEGDKKLKGFYACSCLHRSSSKFCWILLVRHCYNTKYLGKSFPAQGSWTREKLDRALLNMIKEPLWCTSGIRKYIFIYGAVSVEKKASFLYSIFGRRKVLTEVDTNAEAFYLCTRGKTVFLSNQKHFYCRYDSKPLENHRSSPLISISSILLK